MKLNMVKTAVIALATIATGMSISSCEDQEGAKYEVAGGQPEILYVITTDKAASDSIISSAFTETPICIVGNNLRSVKKIFFNDREATLSPSFINNHTLIVSVPSTLPDDITNKIYFHAQNGAVVEHPFTVQAPGPSISSINCEFIQPGEQGVLKGNYFVDNATTPLQVIMPDGKSAKINSFEQTSITFTVPDGCSESGQIKVITAYGEGKSSFYFNDDRNIIMDFDGQHGGLRMGNGWRWDESHLHKGDCSDIPQVSGDFLFFCGDLDEYGGWNDGGFEYDIWTDANFAPLTQQLPKFAAMLNNNAIADLCVKFECYIPSASPWGAGGLQFIWMGDEYGNAPHSTPSYPRGMWRPWVDTCPYSTDNKWITVTIPMTEFCYGPKNQPAGASVDNETYFHGLTIFVLEGYDAEAVGTIGKKSSPRIAIDNVRVVPIK